MSCRRLSIGLLLAFAAIAGTARPLHAFCRTPTCAKDCDFDPITFCPAGPPIAWPQLCVTYSMQYEASRKFPLETATRIAEQAFGAWQNVTCPGGGAPSIQLDHAFGTVACKVHEYNQSDGNANIIMFHDDQWPYPDDGITLALTTVTFSKKTGDIYDADMEINATQPITATDVVESGNYDLLSVVTHEAGHFLGLGHSLDPDATMSKDERPGTDAFRDLADDDIAGICAIYPPTTAASVCDYVPSQGFSPECGLYPAGRGSCAVAPVSMGARSTGIVPLFLAGLAWALGRRRASARSSSAGGSRAATAAASRDRRRRNGDR